MKRALWIIFLFLPISSWSEVPNHHLAKTSQSSNAEGQDAYQAKDYSYLLGKVEGLSDKLLSMHFTLYKGYVKSANLLASSIKEMRRQGEDLTIAYGALIRRFAWEYDGMYLHELYFDNLRGSAFLEKNSPLYQKIEQDFGAFETWKQNFLATGLIRGIGWVILYLDPVESLLKNIWIDEHNINHIPGGTPILVMDVWEHAYMIEYGLDRKKYIEVFFKNIDWNLVEKRYKNSRIK